jgi:hypothetical protein
MAPPPHHRVAEEGSGGGAKLGVEVVGGAAVTIIGDKKGSGHEGGRLDRGWWAGLEGQQITVEHMTARALKVA